MLPHEWAGVTASQLGNCNIVLSWLWSTFIDSCSIGSYSSITEVLDNYGSYSPAEARNQDVLS